MTNSYSINIPTETYDFTLSTDDGMIGLNLFNTFGQLNQ
jgi:hypothetical protein